MLTIKAEVRLGDDIKGAFEDAIALSKKLGCYVDFDFNGVTCSASPLGDAEKGVAKYHAALKDEIQFKIAIA